MNMRYLRKRPKHYKPWVFVLIAVMVSCAGLSSRVRSAQANAAPQQALTVAAVQGDGDSAIAAASEFLTGCSASLKERAPFENCSSTLHLPLALQQRARHLHVDGRSDYSPFYLDETVIDNAGGHGKDLDPQQGLEGSHVLFYAGHGHIDSFHALANSNNKSISLSNFSLGDRSVRYLLMLSCNIFAHGPIASGDFTRPQDFDPSYATGSDYANVFQRWTRTYGSRTPLNHGLRLACGGASHIGNLDHPSHLLWHYYSILGFGPAESFLLGLYQPENSAVPLCMSRGGDSPHVSGLYDPRFVVDRPKGKDQNTIYIEYPLTADDKDLLLKEATKTHVLRYSQQREPRDDEPQDLPVLLVGPAPIPSFLNSLDFSDAPSLDYGFRGGSARDLKLSLSILSTAGEPAANTSVDAGDLCVKRHPGSGAIILSLRPRAGSGIFSKEEGAAVLESMAKSMVERVVSGGPGVGINSPNGFTLREAQPIEMRIDGASAVKVASGDLQLKDISHPKKCHYLRLTSVYQENGREIPIFGEGGEILFGLCVPGLSDEASGVLPNVCQREVAPLLSVSLGGRALRGTERKPEVTLKTKAVAQKEALRKLLQMKSGESYESIPRQTRWGYKAAPVYCAQERMYIVYEFDFFPKAGAAKELPPVTVEIPAHKLPPPAEKIEDTWACSSEV
jgi:hypothetical protein